MGRKGNKLGSQVSLSLEKTASMIVPEAFGLEQTLSQHLDTLSLQDQIAGPSKQKSGRVHVQHTTTNPSFTGTAVRDSLHRLSVLEQETHDADDARPSPAPQDDLLEIVSTPDRGLAVFATRKVKAGTLLLAERPLVRLQKHEEDDPAAIEREFSRLGRADQRIFLKLFDAQKSRMTRVVSIYYSNCYNLDDHVADGGRGGSAVGPFASRINHGCVPNVQFCYDEKTDEMRFRAVRDIPRGKELCSNYDKAVSEVRTKRRRKQQIHYGFVCRCEACEPKTGFWARSDERRRAMYEALRVARACEKECSSKRAPAPPTVVVDRAIEALVRLEELFLKEGLVGVPLANTRKSLAKWAERKYDHAQAVKWKTKELEVCKVSFGSDALRTKGVEDQLIELSLKVT
ncbi:uncharacterized protein PV06_04158 [Exophiala oligosperma]|uniref:SET domain-containing protein n=1 Tax=Exophiala oligosperma TaxID=215243 RepID=A0A0D2DKV7_9EURO|nr:uncharacterized protein PV06_04158 [Exophiala oligosperma]KIW43005.1 hypothetical protein PV06_04158 [Exophiala oligosperma]